MKPQIADCLTKACQKAVPGLSEDDVRRTFGLLFCLDELIATQAEILASMDEAKNPRLYAQERGLMQMLQHLNEQDTAPHALAMACISLLCLKPRLALVK